MVLSSHPFGSFANFGWHLLRHFQRGPLDEICAVVGVRSREASSRKAPQVLQGLAKVLGVSINGGHPFRKWFMWKIR